MIWVIRLHRLHRVRPSYTGFGFNGVKRAEFHRASIQRSKLVTDIENGIDQELSERGVSYNYDITLRPDEFRFREYGHARKPSE